MLNMGEELCGVAAASLPQQLMATLKRNKARILDLFRALDVNHDGIITQAEFQMGMSALGLSLSDKDVDYLFDVLDVSDDGQADFNELKALLAMKTLDDADSYGMAKVCSEGARRGRARRVRALPGSRCGESGLDCSPALLTHNHPRLARSAHSRAAAILAARRSARPSCRRRIGGPPTWTRQ